MRFFWIMFYKIKHCFGFVYNPVDDHGIQNYYDKLCELLDQRIFLPYFPMLKDREKRIEQDVIWKNICKELDWEFIPTI